MKTPAKRTVRTRTKELEETFLTNLRNGRVVSEAARAIGVPRRTMYEWRDRDEAFAERWDEAVEEGTEMLEAEANRRAFQGTLDPVYQQGMRVGTKRVYSDALAALILKKRNPEFKERHEVSGTGKGGAISIFIAKADEKF